MQTKLEDLLFYYDYLKGRWADAERALTYATMDDYGNPTEVEYNYYIELKQARDEARNKLDELQEKIIADTTVNSLNFASEMSGILTERSGEEYLSYIKEISGIEYLCISKADEKDHTASSPISAGEIVVDADTKITEKSERSTVVSKKTIILNGKEVVVRLTSFLPLKYKNIFVKTDSEIEPDPISVPVVEP